MKCHEVLKVIKISRVIFVVYIFCCGQQLTQKLEITLEASKLGPITQQFTQNWE
jgi:hypothetical protein